MQKVHPLSSLLPALSLQYTALPYVENRRAVCEESGFQACDERDSEGETERGREGGRERD